MGKMPPALLAHFKKKLKRKKVKLRKKKKKGIKQNAKKLLKKRV